MPVWYQSRRGGNVVIQAHIEMNLNNHISVISACVIELIKENDEIILESLMKKFLKKYYAYDPIQFMDSLTFLFAINVLKIENFKVKISSV